MQINVKRIEKSEWVSLSRDAHVSVFKEEWEAEKERVDFALLTTDSEDQLIQYATLRELDSESVYIQYGGSFPTYRGSIPAYRSFQAILRWLGERYPNVTFLTENTNLAMLKFAIREGFIIVGLRATKKSIMLELYKTKGE